MRQSKYDKPLLQQESIGNGDGKQQVANFENRVELGTEGDRLAELLANVKDLIIEVKECEDALAEAKVQCRFAISALYSSASKASGSAASFDKSVERLGKIRIDCKISPEDEKKLKEQSKRLFDGEKTLLVGYLNEVRKSHEGHWADVKNLVKSNDGICLTGWMTKFAIVSYILFFIYFCITITCFIML